VDTAVLASARHAADGGYESRSGYRTPNEGVIGGLDVFAVSDDAMIHTLFVEWSAIQLGDFDAIYRVVRSAAGSGANSSPEFVRRAQAVLRKVAAPDLTVALQQIEVTEPNLLKALNARMSAP
jgi:putative chitinase